MCGITFFVFDGRYIFLALNISLYVIFFLKKRRFFEILRQVSIFPYPQLRVFVTGFRKLYLDFYLHYHSDIHSNNFTSKCPSFTVVFL